MPTSALPSAAAQAATIKLGATLTGPNEPAGGDPDGSGTFVVEIDPDAGDFCYTITSAKIAAPTMAHVHTGAVGVNGAPVVRGAVGAPLVLGCGIRLVGL